MLLAVQHSQNCVPQCCSKYSCAHSAGFLQMVYDQLAHEAAGQCDDAEVKLRAEEEALMQVLFPDPISLAVILTGVLNQNTR